ncbi:hypothetical protein Nepgr_022944 [Nepenthes gracilis]|uniref:Uncharacterized protein n=1 Tax=Nepenthes gracilis TaxID=150966 RepID=A0AAD3XX99_NEPGR|nr:hypothetical protein Nepgr_022944 [Nepenthes gracilis]
MNHIQSSLLESASAFTDSSRVVKGSCVVAGLSSCLINADHLSGGAVYGLWEGALRLWCSSMYPFCLLVLLTVGGGDPSAVAFMWSKSHGLLKLGGFSMLPASPELCSDVVDPEASGFAACVEVPIVVLKLY